MDNQQPRVNRDAEALLQNLMTTPVGRRWLLKAGLGSAAAIAAAHLPMATRSANATAWAAGLSQTTSPTPASQPSPTAPRTLHFALGPATSGANAVSNLRLIANGAEVPLIAHTPTTRAALHAQGGLFAAANLDALTHFVSDVQLPSNRGMLVTVQATRGTDEVLVSQMFHAPETSTLAMARLAASGGNGLRSLVGSDDHLKTLGLSAAQVTAPEHVAQLDSIGDAQSTAVAMTMLHPNVATVDPTSVTATKSVLGQTPEIGTLGTSIATLQSQGKDFARMVPATLGASLQSGVSAGVKGVRNTGGLGQVIDKPIDDYPKGTKVNTWVQSQGVTPQPQPYSPPAASPTALGSGGTIDVDIANTGLLYGPYTKATAPMNSSGQVPIRIYNNYVRWISTFVQYIGKDSSGNDTIGKDLSGNDTNLSLNPSASWPETKYSKALHITELPETIDASTVFERADTFLYSDSAGSSGGYTWSNASGVTEAANAAVPTSGAAIQAVTGATVATKAGVVGMVWKRNDRYYLQGVPVDQNTDTLDLVGPSKNSYARPPFLLFDAFVAPQDQGNHVLLEPDDTTDAYFVRQVSVDSTTGALTWDSTTNLGTFLLPVSAAALHSSGRVVTVHTDSGRVGTVHPVDTSDPTHPQLAAYSAGPGTQIGLLQSPTAVAVTNPGTVIILEAGAGQLAAFDLNGNPVKYFGTDPNNLQYTQPLANPGTYTDLAVDGANHIYLLYYTNDGSQAGDYHVDVYNPNGTPLATQSPGTNVSKLAVDFWRSIYGVNFTSTQAPSSSALAMPSMSRFDPTTGGSA